MMMGSDVHCVIHRYLFIVCLLSAGATADTVTFLIAAGTVEPYQIVSDDPGRTPHSGILIDVLRQALSKTDIQLEFVERPYKRIRMDILANRHQNWISYGSPSWLDERLRAVGEYTQQPILQAHYVMATMRRAELPSLDDIHGKRVITILGYNYFSGFDAWVKTHDITLVSAPSHRHALAMLKQGRGDFYLAEDVRVRWELSRGDMRMSDLQLLDFSSVIPPSRLYLLLDARMPGRVKEQINTRLLQLHREGGMEDILDRYR
ncbi:MAG TPA: ABC transporter substrate-binding protein [Cellvibrio sp.]|nr:ABC transporter substrate-binding protein [Cellvibrio sp.]